MTSNELSLLAGAVLSLGFTYIPGLNAWFAAKPATEKKLWMAVLTLLIAVLAFAAACANLVDLPLISTITCDKAGVTGLAVSFVLALVANQGTDRISPEPQIVKTSKVD